MTDTMDKAIEAAVEKLGKDALLSYPPKTNPANMKAAIQAALEVLLPEKMTRNVTFSDFEKGLIYSHNQCLSEIRNRAGME